MSDPDPGVPAWNDDETAQVLACDYGVLDPDLADRVREVTGGRPDLVRLAGANLVVVDPAAVDLAGVLAEPLRPYVESWLRSALPDAVVTAVREVAGLTPVTAALWSALGHDPATFDLLHRVGVLVAGTHGTHVVPVIAEILAGSCRFEDAATWYAVHGPVFAAVRTLDKADRIEPAAELIDVHGDALLAAGHAALLIDVLQRSTTTRRRQLLLGDALRVSGQVLSAARAYDRIEKWEADLAWRTGLVHYLRGDSRTALEAFERAPLTVTTVDTALVRAWAAVAQLQLGEVEAATERARAAMREAAVVCDDAALATASVSLALCLSLAGETTESDELLAQALRISGQLGDVVLRARVLTTQTYRLLREARYAEALDTARRTAQCALAAGHANLRSIALCNEADALTMLGRFDEAVRQYERAIALGRRMGSRRSAAAYLGIGEVYRRRGWTEQARGAYDTAIQLAEAGGNNQVLVSALSGLAQLLAPIGDKQATQAAEQARALAGPGELAGATLAQGWISLYANEAPAAEECCATALAAARTDGDRAVLADALELRAALSTDARKAREALREAEAIWSTAGSIVEAARVRCLMGSLAQASTDDRLAALLAADVLASSGVRAAADGAPPVAIRAFGRFEVLVAGEPVAATQWQSRKARDLLRVLVARRGRPVPRGELSELLWPDDDPERTGHRLSVLLSIVRGVLDPFRVLPADHFLAGDQASVALATERIDVDVEAFLTDVGHGRRLYDRGALAQAYALLSAADARYRSDVFEDEPYADWAQPLREEARASRVTALRLLAQIAQDRGDPAAAVGHLLQLLALDPYDEGGHRALIETHTSAGQHGEARRAYARYRSAMEAIGVRPPVLQYHDPIVSP